MNDDRPVTLITSLSTVKDGVGVRRDLPRRWLAWTLCLSIFASAQSQPASVDKPSTLLRVWGTGIHGASPFLPVLTMLEDRYRLQHSQVRFEHHLNGDDSALGGLYSGAADLVFMQREPSYIELDGYQQVLTREKPVMRHVLLGHLQAGGLSSPLVIIVNRNNPLSRLALEQVDSIFNAEQDASGKAEQHSILRWSGLGLHGSWGGQLLHLYGFHPQSPESQALVAQAMHGVVRWPCAYVVEGSSAGGATAAASVTRRVALDRYGIGVTALHAVTPAVRVVPIMDGDGIPQTPGEVALLNGRYGLERGVTALFRDRPGATNEEARHFVDYLSSDEADKVIRAEGSYLPSRVSRQPGGRP